MKRKVFLSVLAGVLLSVAPTLAAAPFGWFGGILGAVDNGGSAVIPVAGWALDDNGVQSVDILVDGSLVGRAFYGMSWEGVSARYPNFPDSALPGFGYFLDTSHYLNGLHVVQPRVRSKAGEIALLEPRVIQFTNNEATMLPFGAIDFPQAHAEMRGTCTSGPLVRRRLSVVSGWALDAGNTPQDYGIGYVQLLIDRAVAFDSDLDCFSSPLTGGLAECYGLLRQDIERQYPSLKDSPHSGLRFVLDIGSLLPAPGEPPFLAPYSEGAHLLTIRAGDHADNARNIAEIPVTFSCDEDNSNENSFGDIDVPLNGHIYSGVITTSGWALDWNGVKAVFIQVDGTTVGTATYGFPRSDAELAFHPNYPNSLGPGWRFSFDTRQFSNGEHSLDVVVLDDSTPPGINTFIGKRRFVIGNDL